MNTQNKVFSYTRFSSPEQSKGDSQRRQDAGAQAYAQQHGMILDDTLKMVDKGLSGYHGRHRTHGALGEFLQRVKSGAVPRNSILLIENVDRLGREPVATAQATILALLEHGIQIVTLSPPDEYTLSSYNAGGHWRMSAHIERAHSESQRKSDLAQANWKQKRKLVSERILTRRVPAWLQVVNGKFQVIREAAQAVELVYKLKSEGFGKFAIERKLNKSSPWSPKNGWRGSYVDKLLRNPSVTGQFQLYSMQDGKRVPVGDVINDYFPPIVSAKVFYSVQRKMKANGSNKGRGGGRTGSARNLFQGVVRCGYCSGVMVYINRGPSSKGGKFLVCDTARRGRGCKAHSVKYAEFEETMLANLSKLRPEAVLPDASTQATQANALRYAITGCSGEMASIENQITNLVAQIASTSNASLRQRYEKRAAELEDSKVVIEASRIKQESSLRELERGSQSFAKWQKDLIGLKKAIATSIDTRIKLRSHLRELIRRVDIYGRGEERSVEHALALIDDYAPTLGKDKTFPAFKRYLSTRMVSKDARFFSLLLHRVKDDIGFDIAPAESLAAHVVIGPGKELKFRAPGLAKLLRSFYDGRKSGWVPKVRV